MICAYHYFHFESTLLWVSFRLFLCMNLSQALSFSFKTQHHVLSETLENVRILTECKIINLGPPLYIAK